MKKELKFYITKSAEVGSGMETHTDEIKIEVPAGVDTFDELLSFELTMSSALAEFLKANVFGELQIEQDLARYSE